MTVVADLPISHVFLRADARKIDRAAVKSLMASIEEVGIINPLRVRPARRNVNGEIADAYEVTAGGHRLDAAIHLGFETVPCIVVEDTDLAAELAMIDENLCRVDLSPADRAAQTARRKAIYLELHPETAEHVAGGKGNATAENFSAVPSFAADTAAKTGVTDRVVRLHTERGEKIAPDVLEQVKGTDLDKGTYLDTLKKLDPDQQRQRVARALASTKPGKPVLSDAEAVEKQFQAIVSAWNRAGPEARDRFKSEYIDEPIMDRRFA